MQSQFKIDGWESQQPPASLSHRHQLKGLQQIITKAKAVRKPLQLQLHPNNPATQQQNSFISLKANHKKYRTEQIYRHNSSAQISNLMKRPQLKQSKIQLVQQSRSNGHQQILHNILKLKQQRSSSGQIFATSPKFGLQHMRKLKAKPQLQVKGESNSISKPQGQKARDSKVINKYQKIRRYRTNVSSEQCLVMLPNFKDKEKSKSRVKSFFIETIQNLDSKSRRQNTKINGKLLNKQGAQQESPENVNKWKNMMKKSNKRKKQLEELFKTRPLFGSKQIERRIGASNLSRLLQQQSKRALVQRMARNQFDDDSLYCPWSYREQRLVHHLKSKQNK